MRPNEFVAFEGVFVRIVVVMYALQFIQYVGKSSHMFIALFHDLRFFGQ
jgi:hypothetical protein